jgi:signal transduction histidine kinase
MPTLRASVLIVSHPDPKAVAFGADFATDLTEAEKAIGEFSYPVIVIPCSEQNADSTVNFLMQISADSPTTQQVILQNDTPAESLRSMINLGSLFRILHSYNDSRFEHTIQEALEEYRLLQQNSKLLQLVNDQNERLKRLTTELEGRVETRRKSLEDAKEKLLTTNHRVEALHRALVAIHRAGSIVEMETLINEALSGALGLSWTRILFHSQAGFHNYLSQANEAFSLQTAPLTRGKDTLGHIHFAREAKSPFTRDENSFLSQIAEAVSLAIDRLTKLEQSETLKHQWEATFDAILEPVSVIDEDYKVVRINRAFAERAGVEPDQVIGQKCHQMLFGQDTPCLGCHSGSNFRLKPSKTSAGTHAIYDVFSQAIPFAHEKRSLFVNMYHDASERLRFERQILESAKMAELGTIGSSIAHELNNPLGGMLSFLQLIKMDLKGGEPWNEDIAEMETGARRCRDIVQSLLGFTRKSARESTEIIDLREVIDQALKITELQTRAMGVAVSRELPDFPIEIRGQFTFLAQALRHFFQGAQEAIEDRMKISTRFSGKIIVRLYQTNENGIIEIIDNGIGLPVDSDTEIHPGLGLTLARQIITDHGGTLEFSAKPEIGARAIISLPRPVFAI